MATFDILVVGAGPAGSTAAIEFARQGRSVAIIEKAAFPRRKVCGEFMSATNVPVLRRLGVEVAWRAHAGPQVRRLALFAAEHVVEAPMPGRHGFGRALGRDVLDGLLLDAARRHGATVFQPCRASALTRDGACHALTVVPETGESLTLRAPVLVAAHGSWERGGLPTNLPKIAGNADMLGFKAHFRGGSLAPGTMPLLAFPGGYGGMVWADDGRLSLSLCIRRDTLAALRQGAPHLSAAQVVDAHLRASCTGLRQVLAGAEPCGAWLATGPIRPGIRARYAHDIFRIGNVAGEAHPVIAEGISMAIQSASLLAQALDGVDLENPAARAAAGRRYGAEWARRFALRIRLAGVVAALASRPATSGPLAAAVGALPSLLTLGARLSGKTQLSPHP